MNIQAARSSEYLFLLTMDGNIHQFVDFGMMKLADFSTYHSTLWFVNGRNAPIRCWAQAIKPLAGNNSITACRRSTLANGF